MMNRFLIFCVTLITFFSFTKTSFAEDDFTFGVEAGWAFSDIKAEESARLLASLCGCTVSYTYDTGTAVLKGVGQLRLDEQSYVEAGYFITSDLEATYVMGANSATESYNIHGAEASYNFTSGGFDLKIGAHFSTVDGNASITIGNTAYDLGTLVDSGSGYVAGVGYDMDGGYQIRATYYGNLGGESDNTATLVSAVWSF